MFKSKLRLEAHLVRVHDYDRRFKCSTCPATFIHAKDLQRHAKNFHGPGSG